MGQPKRFTDEELRAHKNARTAQRYREQKDKISAYHAALHRSRKNDPDYMAKLRAKTKAWRAANPQKNRDSSAKSRIVNRDKRLAIARAWFARNPEKRAIYQQNRRAKLRSVKGKISVNIYHRLMELQRGRCACCHADLTTVKPNLDHRMPLAKGGPHEDANLQLLCSTCNSQKRDKDPIQFMQEKGFLI